MQQGKRRPCSCTENAKISKKARIEFFRRIFRKIPGVFQRNSEDFKNKGFASLYGFNDAQKYNNHLKWRVF